VWACEDTGPGVSTRRPRKRGSAPRDLETSILQPLPVEDEDENDRAKPAVVDRSCAELVITIEIRDAYIHVEPRQTAHYYRY
jgi:hypothetical protein